jgi:calpain-7
MHPALLNGHLIQNLYERATRAELAKDLDTAFRLYVEAGNAFLNVDRTVTHARTQEQARQEAVVAARALERAKLIKAVKPDVTPVLRDPFALGS